MASLVVFAAAVFVLLAGASVSSSTVFTVGDEKGWAVPSGNGTESYNHWAKRNRFQVGDVLDFKYVNDSVLVVNHDDYKRCSAASPVSRFTDGDTKFTFDRYGLFYFMSGVPGHCEGGQRMIVRVMGGSAIAASPAPAPAPTQTPTMPPSSTVSDAPSPAVSARGTPSSPSSQSPSPSPLGPSSGASGRRVLSGFSIVGALLFAFDVAVFVMV